jgi:hypothetical protein
LEKDGAGNSAILHLLPGSLSRNNGSEFKYQQGRGFNRTLTFYLIKLKNKKTCFKRNFLISICL